MACLPSADVLKHPPDAHAFPHLTAETMADPGKITSETALIMERMVNLDPEDDRYHMLKATLDYKASWLELAERLNVLADTKEYKQWGYKTFKAYCTEELQLTNSQARKLVRGFQWIDKEAPQLLPRFVDDEVEVAANDSRVVPDIDTVNVLVKAQKEVEKERLSADDYEGLKERALSGEPTARDLRKELKEAVVEPEKDPREEQLKILRRSLSATKRLLSQLEEAGNVDDEIHELAEQLQQKIFDLVSRLMDEQAYTDGGEAAEAADAKLSGEGEKKGGKTERVTVIVGSREGVAGD